MVVPEKNRPDSWGKKDRERGCSANFSGEGGKKIRLHDAIREVMSDVRNPFKRGGGALYWLQAHESQGRQEVPLRRGFLVFAEDKPGKVVNIMTRGWRTDRTVEMAFILVCSRTPRARSRSSGGGEITAESWENGRNF